MCTVTKEEPILQIAEEDIVVYKAINIRRKFLFFKSYRSAIANFKYKKGKVYETELSPFFSSSCLNSKGKSFNLWKSSTGFYSYKDPDYLVNAIFIIPKGSKYYLCKDIYDYYVYHSNKIKLFKIIK